jgi:hypothetical protein
VQVDVASWFRDGTRIVNPSTANVGGANERLVASNIKRSFHAFEDHDRDGEDDHGGHGGDDDSSGHQ